MPYTNSNNNNRNTNYGGSSYNNERWEPSSSSVIRISNSDYGRTSLSFGYWNGILKVLINPFNPASEGSQNTINYGVSVSVYLMPAKAILFLHAIREFRKNPDKYDNLAVSTKTGFVAIVNGKKSYNEDGIFISVQKIDKTGRVIGADRYKINDHFDMRHRLFMNMNLNNPTDNEHRQDYDGYSPEDVELDLIETSLEEYIKASTNAYGHFDLYANRTHISTSHNFMSDARVALGISSRNNNNGRSTRTWMDASNNNSTSYSSNNNVQTNTEEYNEVMNDISSLMD